MTSTWTRETLSKDVVEELKAEITGKTVLVTGTTIGGLGFEAAHDIAKYAKLVILVGRNAEKLQKSEEKIITDYPDAKLRKVVADLASFESVRAAAAEINALGEPIHVVIANAIHTPGPYLPSPSGPFESQFGVDHLGHFLLLSLIFPSVLSARPSPTSSPSPSSPAFAPRIVSISSIGHRRSGPIRFEGLTFEGGKEYSARLGYAHAKTANLLFVREFVRRAEGRGVGVFSVYPGAIWTTGYDNISQEDKIVMGICNPDGSVTEGMKSMAKQLNQGATAYIVAGFDPRIKEQSGSLVFDDGQIQNDKIAPHASDLEDAKRLWELSEKLVGQIFDV